MVAAFVKNEPALVTREFAGITHKFDVSVHVQHVAAARHVIEVAGLFGYLVPHYGDHRLRLRAAGGSA